METSPHSRIPSALALCVHLQREGGPVERLFFDAPEITIGRRSARGGPAPTLAIADRSVSRRHAALLVGPARLVLEDRGGRAGVFLDGRRIRRSQGLRPGQRFSFAGYTAWVERLVGSGGGRAPVDLRGAEAGDGRGGSTPGREAAVGGGEAPLSERLGLSTQAPDRSAAAPGSSGAPGGPAETGALEWIRAGEPEGLLLRGRELRRAARWLGSRPATPTADPRRRWIEGSEGLRQRRARRRGGAGLTLATALGLGLLLGVDDLPEAEVHPPEAPCTRAELTALQGWLEEEPGNLHRNALALAWARTRGCRSAVFEGAAHRALTRTPSEQVGEVRFTGEPRLASVGLGEALLLGPEQTLHWTADRPLSPIGLPGSVWRTSGDGRWAAELAADRRRVVLWAFDGGFERVTELALGGPIAAVALDETGRSLWVASEGRVHRWRRSEGRWIEGEGRDDGLGIEVGDRLIPGLGGLVIDRGGALWWLPANSGRARSVSASAEPWTLVGGGESLITASGGVVRRWRVRRRRLRGEVIAEFEEPVVHMRAIAGAEGGGVGGDLALATTSALHLVDTRQRWRPRQAITRRIDHPAVDRIVALESDPQGHRLVALEGGGATVWDLRGDPRRDPPTAEFTWRGGPPSIVALSGEALLTIAEGRVERWPLIGAEGGFDGAAVEFGEARTLALDPTGRRFAAGGASRARLWSRVDGSRWTLAADMDVGEPVTAMAFAGESWALVHGDTLDIHGLGASGEIVSSARSVMASSIERLAVAAKGPRLVAVDARGDLLSVPVRSEAKEAPHLWSLGLAATALAVEPGGAQVLVGDHRGGVFGIQADRPGAARTLPPHDGAVVAAAVSEGGAWCVTSGEDRRLHMVTEGVVRGATMLPEVADSLAFLGDGAWLAARERSGRITVHGVGSSREVELGVRPGPPGGLVGDGERLYVRGEDGSVELWELRLSAGRPRIEAAARLVAGDGGGARPMEINPGGAWMLSAEGRGAVRARPLATDGLVELLCGLQPTGDARGGPVPMEFAASVCTEFGRASIAGR